MRTAKNEVNTVMKAHPFIKWVGGKTQLLQEIERSLSEDFSTKQEITYIEPFVGGGAVLFWILQKYNNITKAIINDVNAELICTYKVVKNHVSELIERLAAIQSDYVPLSSDERKRYYLQRRTEFNEKPISDIETAALFIFLNRTCFNGLYRVNSKGQFNVPHGRYANPKICDTSNLLACSNLLQNVEILCGDFVNTLQFASDRALFYLDPPYRPLTETSSFTAYSLTGFDDREQLRLRDFCEQITVEQAMFIASNSDPTNIKPNEDFFDRIYSRFNIRRVSATRMINSVSTGRGAINEVIISNL